MPTETMTEPQSAFQTEEFKQQVRDALDAPYAPVRVVGRPSLLRLFGMIVSEIFHPQPPVPRNPHDEPVKPNNSALQP